MSKKRRIKIIYRLIASIFLSGYMCLSAADAAPLKNTVAPGKAIPAKVQVAPPPSSTQKPEDKAYQSAQKLFTNKDYAGTIAGLRLFLNKYPNSRYRSPAQQTLAASYYLIANYYEALNIYNELLAKDPLMTTDEIRRQMGDCYYALQNYQQALNQYQQLLTASSQAINRERLLYKILLATYNLGDIAAAQATLQQMNGESLALDEKINLLLTQAQIARKVNAYRPAWQSALKAMLAAKQNAFPDAFKYKTQAEAFLQEIITGFLPKDELGQMLLETPHEFPGGDALWHMAQLELKDNNTTEAFKLIERFITDFSPQYPHYQEALALYQQLADKVSSDSYKLGVIVPLSGKAASLGQMVWRGVKLAVDEDNQTTEPPVDLLLKDSQANGNIANQALLDLADRKKVLAVVGPLMNKEAVIIAKTANEQQIPLLTPAAAAEGIPQSGPYVFRNCLTGTQQVESIVRFAVVQLGLRNFVIFTSSNPYSQELVRYFIAELQKYGLPNPPQFTYTPQETDFRRQIEAIYKLSPEVLFLPDFSDKIIPFAPQLAFYAPKKEAVTPNQPPAKAQPTVAPKATTPLTDLLPWEQEGKYYFSSQDNDRRELRLPQVQREQKLLYPNHATKFFLLGTHGWYSPQLLKEGDRTLEGAIFPCGFFSQSTKPEVKNFVQHFKERFGEEPDLLAAQAYDSARMLLQALHSGATTRQEIRDNLSELYNFHGITGLTSFNAEREAQKDLALVTVKKHTFVQLSGEETRLLVSQPPAWYPLLKERNIERLLSEDLYGLLGVIGVADLQ